MSQNAPLLAPLHRLPLSALRGLASSLETGLLSAGITQVGIAQAAGTDAAAVADTLRSLGAIGMTPRQMAVVVRGIAEAHEHVPKPSSLFDLVLSGPDLPGVPMADTAAVVHTMISQASREVWLVGYAVYNGRKLFEPLARRMNDVPELTVRFCLDIARQHNDATPAADIVARFARDFRARHWPWDRLPELYYDPRSLETGDGRESLHAKCVIVDGERALVTSANFTDAAQRRNIELGVVISHRPTVARLTDYFAGLCIGEQFARCPLG
ncbi:MAG: DISARM system phospholipase D-like protein DrmC [Planctomycetia bacterium]